MSSLKQKLSRLRVDWLFLVAVVLLVCCKSAFAQEETEEAAGPVWTMHYILSLLLVVLGVSAVGFGSNRIIQEERLKEQAETAERNKEG